MFKKCRICNKNFEISEQEKVYCSQECREHYKQYIKKHRKELILRSRNWRKSHRIQKTICCKYCSKEFEQTTRHKTFCSLQCYIEYRIQYLKKYNKKYREIHKIQRNIYNRLYKKHNRQEINEYENLKRQEDINFRLRKYLSTRIWKVLKHNVKTDITINLLGCSIDFLKSHLEKQFKIGMSWSNYGAWHIDHIRPCSSFDLSKVEQQRKCFNYSNLQPLWALENLVKSDKILT